MGTPETSPILPIYASEYRQRVDEKRRLQIPSKWRADGPASELALVLWPNGFDKNGCLMAFPTVRLGRLLANLDEKPFSDPEANAIRRFVGSRADTATVDKAGRIVVPEAMAKAVGIDKNAVLVGMLDRFQIWQPEKYEASQPAIETVAATAWQKF